MFHLPISLLSLIFLVIYIQRINNPSLFLPVITAQLPALTPTPLKPSQSLENWRLWQELVLFAAFLARSSHILLTKQRPSALPSSDCRKHNLRSCCPINWHPHQQAIARARFITLLYIDDNKVQHSKSILRHPLCTSGGKSLCQRVQTNFSLPHKHLQSMKLSVSSRTRKQKRQLSRRRWNRHASNVGRIRRGGILSVSRKKSNGSKLRTRNARQQKLQLWWPRWCPQLIKWIWIRWTHQSMIISLL
jgi:hypothetical protein